jgi:hypothetical protein
MIVRSKWKLLNPVIISTTLHETNTFALFVSRTRVACRNHGDKLRQPDIDPRRSCNTPERRISEYPCGKDIRISRKSCANASQSGVNRRRKIMCVLVEYCLFKGELFLKIQREGEGRCLLSFFLVTCDDPCECSK